MVVPSSEQEWLTCPVFEWDWDRLLDDTASRTQRPLPSSTFLASFVPVDLHVTTTRGFAMPLLQHLHLKGQVTETDDITENIDVTEESLEEIDDAQSSTLTRGQHARYQQLQAGDSWKEATRKEFRRLDQRVKAEQELYFKALETFWEKHHNHYKVGLESPFARYCFAYAQKYQEQWHGSYFSRYYGKCCQVLSLQHISQKANLAKKSFTLDSIHTKLVHICGEEEPPPTVTDKWQMCSPVFDESNMPTPLLLQDDPLALDLAKKHNASIVTTEETLAALLKLSGRIPMCHHHDGIVVLDLPLPHPMTPRECLSRGVTEGFYQTLSKHASPTHFVYTFVTLGRAKATRRILVRSNRRLQDNEKQPLCVHVQLEYFPNRGWEEISSHERAVWILENVLLDARVWVVRVCPSTMRSLQWEEMSVAHALASGSSSCSTSIDPMNHWETLFEVLLAMETIVEGNHLLCFEGSSISVHTASNDDRVIDIFEELNKAEAVYTGAVALRQCARMWHWNQERIPYTFPIKDDVAKNKG